jgi:TetR/AcrR family fatty acid metabolism transcriptional regulator
MSNHSSRGERGERGERGGGDKRERIIDAALRVFASKGFFGAKVADVAQEAGVADGTIYLYFKSKDDLLISLFEQQMSVVVRELNTALAGAKDPVDKLRRFIRAYVRLVQENRHGTEVITIELRQSAKFMKEYGNPRFAEFLKLLASVIDEGQKQGTLRADIPAPVAARALFGALDELALWWVSGKGEKLDISKVADWVGDLVLNGLTK